MEAAEDAAAAPESWETADLDGAMSRLLLSSSSSARRVASSPDLADDANDADNDQSTATSTHGQQQQQQDPPRPDDLVSQVNQFLWEAAIDRNSASSTWICPSPSLGVVPIAARRQHPGRRISAWHLQAVNLWLVVVQTIP